MIYLASAYTAPDNNTMETRYREVLEAVAELTRAGLCVYSPIVHFHPVACIHTLPRDIEFWWTHSRHMIDLADEVYVLQNNGWQQSIGVLREIDYTDALGKPVTYLSWEDRSAWPK